MKKQSSPTIITSFHSNSKSMASTSTEKIMMITVPTKQHDGGSKTVSSASFSDAAAPKPKVDTFAKYSSDLVRLKTLMLLGDEEEDEDNLDYLGSLNSILRQASIKDRAARARNGDADASKRRKGNNLYPVTQQFERKTRISFELDPSLILHDLFDFDDSKLIPDDEGEEKLGEEVSR